MNESDFQINSNGQTASSFLQSSAVDGVSNKNLIINVESNTVT